MTGAARLAAVMSILAVVVRLIWVDQPYVDNWSWRQSDVAALARNYFHGGFHFARPQIDWAGDQQGYVGTEFPVLPFLAALCYKIFGVHEWIGRAQGVILFALSLPFFFLLVRKMFGEIAAVCALFFYSFAPLGIMASRCFMPDMPSLALSIAGLYFFERWNDTAKPSFFFASAVAVSFAILFKFPSILIGAPLSCLIFQRFSFSAFRNFRIWLFAAIALLPSLSWYWHAYQISLHFYPHHFFGAGGIRIMPPAWYLKIAKLMVTSTLTPFLFLLGGVGVAMTRSMVRARPFRWWLAAMALFMIVVGYGNRHPWYQLPLIPIFAAFAGAAGALLGTKISSPAVKISISVLLSIAFGFLARVFARDFYRPSAASLRDAGLTLKRMTPRNSLIVAADNGDPTIFYYAERKGWHFLEKEGIYNGEPNESASAIIDLEGLRARGADYLVFTSDTSWWLDYYPVFREYLEGTSTVLEATSEFKIYKLNQTPQ